MPPQQLDDVHRRHRQAGAVDHTADRTVEPNIGQAVLARLAFGRGLLVQVPHFGDIGMAEEGVVVDHHLPVERQQVVVLGYDQGIDLGQGGVDALERPGTAPKRYE